jgi:hypothetical protein
VALTVVEEAFSEELNIIRHNRLLGTSPMGSRREAAFLAL